MNYKKSSVLFARDKWLKQDGLMYPSLAYLYVCPVEMESYLNENLSFWLNFYNLNLEPIAKVFRQLLLEKPIVETLNKSQLIDDEEKILASFDLKTVKIEELESIQSYNIDFVAKKQCNLHGFAFWFDVIFNTDDDNIVILKTGPDSESTHWKQTIALLPEALNSFLEKKLISCDVDENKLSDHNRGYLALNDMDKFECYVIMNQSEENKRFYEIDIGVNLNKEGDENNNLNDQPQFEYEAIDHNLDDEEDDYDDDDYDDDGEHPRPCDCGQIKCIIIKAALERYNNEALELENAKKNSS
jgi:hypothetical protein